MYIKISKNSSAKFYQESKERLQKKFVKDIEIFVRKMKNKILLKIEKKYYRIRECIIIIIRNICFKKQ